GWIGQVRHIRMPDGLAGAEAADGDTVFDHVRHDVNLGMAFDEPRAVFLNGRLIERAEPAAEGDQIGVAELLVAEEQHRVLEPGPINLRKGGVIYRAEIDTAYVGTERRGRGNNLQCRAARTLRVRDQI